MKHYAIASETDACGYVTSYTYDADGHTLTQTKDGKTVTKSYDMDGNLLTSTDWNGVQASYTYDWLGRVIEKRNADDVYYESYTYDANGNLETVYDGFGTSTYTYNTSFGNELQQVTDALGRTKYRVFRNPFPERVMYIVDDYIPYACSTDGKGNVISIGHYIGTYNDSTYTSLDSDGNLVMPTGAENAIEKFTYDKYGNLTSRTDARGNTTEYQYNCQNKLVKVIYPSENGETPAVETYHYNADGTLSYKYERNGDSVSYAYDALGRCTTETYWSHALDNLGTSKWRTYDANGNLLTDGSAVYTYDAFGRVLTKKQDGFDMITYEYDLDPHGMEGLYSECVKSNEFGTLYRVYNSDGLLWRVYYYHGSDSVFAEYTYENGRCKSLETLDGRTISYTYNNAGQITGIVQPGGNAFSEAYRLSYTYDDRANITSEYEDFHSFEQRTKTYSYDNANRLIQETNTEKDTQITYEYDAAGNLLSKWTKSLQNIDEVRGIQMYAYNKDNCISSAFDGTYLYDENENLIKDCYNTAYTYDCYNRVATITKSDGTAISYTYSTENLRTSKTVGNHTTRYCYDTNGNILMEKTDGTIDRIYVWGSDILGMMVPTLGGYELYSYFHNAHGDVTGLYQGDYCYAEYDYDAYGNVVSCSETGISSPIRYAGYYYDTDTQNYYLMNRYYNPYQGRFLTLDPYWNVSNMLYGKFTGTVQKRVYYPAVVQSGNRFAYCGNNPINFTDSTGFDKELDDYIDANYSGKITVTIVAERPVENSRVAVDLATGDVGHTFIRLDYGDGTVIYRGFWPANPLTTEQILQKENVDGRINDDSTHDWNAAVTFEITRDQADKINNFMNSFDEKYNMVSMNCTTFAVKALEEAGIESPTKEHNWTVPDNSHQMIVDNLPNDKWFKKITASVLLSGLKGYSPADAVQDFKSSSQYVLKYDGETYVGTNSGKINK